MKHPLAVLAAVFCAGIILTSLIKVNFVLIYFLAAISLFCAFLFLKKELRFNLFLLGVAFFLGAAGLKSTYLLPRYHISRCVTLQNNESYILKGFVESEPIKKADKLSFVFKVKEIQLNNLNQKCSGRVFVCAKVKTELTYGEGLILKGNMRRPFSFNTPGRRSYRSYLRDQDIWFIVTVKSEAHIRKLNHNQGLVVKRLALYLKHKIEGMLFKHVSFVTAGILDAMILGEKAYTLTFIYDSMVKTGTVHILVVSGFNVGIVSAVIMLFLRLFRFPRRSRLFIAIVLVILYCLTTGASTPVVRATIMAIVFMLAYLLKRQPDIYNSLSLSAIVILGINPRQFFDLGFQLSFASVISIIWLYPKLKLFLRLDSLRIRCLKWLLEGCLVSFSAWMGTMGLIAYNFKFFSPVTVLANLFIVPLASLITLCGFSLVIIGFVYPGLAPLFAHSTELAAKLLVEINLLLLKLPAASFSLP